MLVQATQIVSSVVKPKDKGSSCLTKKINCRIKFPVLNSTRLTCFVFRTKLPKLRVVQGGGGGGGGGVSGTIHGRKK